MSDEDENEEEPWEPWETGPFCQHWSYAHDCDRVCATCGVTCAHHDDCDGDGCAQRKEPE